MNYFFLLFLINIIKINLNSSSDTEIEDFETDKYDGRNGQFGTVYIYEREVQQTKFIYHHYIVFKEKNTSGYVIYEWGDKGHSFYPTEKTKGYPCLKLGNFLQKDVYLAALEASDKKNYKVYGFNCNRWCEKVSSKLGVNIEVIQISGCIPKNELYFFYFDFFLNIYYYFK